MLKSSQIRKLAKGYSDRQLCSGNYGRIITTANCWGFDEIAFYEPTPPLAIDQYDAQVPPQYILDNLADIHTTATTRVWPVSIMALPEIGDAGKTLLRLANNNTEIWVNARHFSTILRKAKHHNRALTFRAAPKHLVIRLNGSPLAVLISHRPPSDNDWTWRFANNDIPRQRQHHARPVEINLEMASQPALM